MSFIKRLTVATVLIGASLISAAAIAQDNYPSKPVNVVVPFNPGPTELTARLIMDELGKRLGQNFLVETMPGASTQIGAEAVMRAEADGYSILFGSASAAVMLKVTKGEGLSFDPVEDFVPVLKVLTRPYVLYVDPKLGYETLEDLIADAKANPGKLTYSSSGVGAHDHLTGAQFADLAGIEMLHIPFGGSSPAIQAVIAGEVSMHFGGPGQYPQYVPGGMLQAMAVTDVEPFVQIPDVPAISDIVPNFVSSGSNDIFVKKGTPDEIVEKLRTEILEVMKVDAVVERVRTAGEPSLATSEEILEEMREQAAMFSKLAEELNIEVE